MRDSIRLLTVALCVGVAASAIVVSMAKQPEENQTAAVIPASKLYPVPSSNERRDLAARIASSDLTDDSKTLYKQLLLQPEAWKSGLIDNLGLESITGKKHDPSLVRQIIWTANVADADGAAFKVYLADRVGRTHLFRGRASYIVTDQKFKLTNWTSTSIDGPLIQKTKLDGNAFPVVLNLSEGSRHNGDVGHFKFRLTRQGIQGIRNAFGQIDWPPPIEIIESRIQGLAAQEQRLIEQLRQSLPMPEEDVDNLCSEFADDATQRSERRAEMELEMVDRGYNAEDMRVSKYRILDDFEIQVQDLMLAESDAFRGRFARLLQLAIERGLARSVEAIVKSGLDLNQPGPKRTLPLHEALVSPSPKAIRTQLVDSLLRSGAKPNTIYPEGTKLGTSGYSPLMMAVHSTDPQLVEIFLSAGADCDATEKRGRNALHLLAYNPHFDESPAIAKLLIEAGCDVDNADENGETIMHTLLRSAASYPDGLENSVQVLTQILDQNPDLSLQDKRGFRAFQPERMRNPPKAFPTVLSRIKDHEVAKPWIKSE